MSQPAVPGLNASMFSSLVGKRQFLGRVRLSPFWCKTTASAYGDTSAECHDDTGGEVFSHPFHLAWLSNAMFVNLLGTNNVSEMMASGIPIVHYSCEVRFGQEGVPRSGQAFQIWGVLEECKSQKKNTRLTCCFHFAPDEDGGAKSGVIARQSYMLLGVNLKDEGGIKDSSVLARGAGTSTVPSKKQHMDMLLEPGACTTLEATLYLGDKMGWLEGIFPPDYESKLMVESPHSSEAFAKKLGFPHRNMTGFYSIGIALTKLARHWNFTHKQVRRVAATVSAPIFLPFEDVRIQIDSWDAASSTGPDSLTSIGFEMIGPDGKIHLRQGCIEFAAARTDDLSSKL